MYKRIYKKACEEIKGDRDAILNKAFERAAQPEKKKSPILKYSVVGTAAAAVIVAGAVILNWDVVKIPLDDIVSEDSAEIIEESQSEAASGETAETEADEAVTAEAETEKAVQTSVVTEETAAETETAKVTPKTQNAAEVTEEEAVIEDSAEDYADAETATEFVVSRGRSRTTGTEDMDEDDGGEVSNGLTSSSSTAGSSDGESAKTEVVTVEEDDDCDYDEDYNDDFSGSTMMLTAGWYGEDYNVEALNYEEYADYLGFDVREIELPDGMSFDWIEESVYEIYTDEEGNISDDTALFTASGEEKSITIITTKMIALDEEFASYENVAANVARNGDYAIYAVKNEAYITIEFDNVESAEIDAIVEQLAE